MIKTTPEGIRYVVTLSPESYSTILTALLLERQKHLPDGTPHTEIQKRFSDLMDTALAEVRAALDEKPPKK